MLNIFCFTLELVEIYIYIIHKYYEYIVAVLKKREVVKSTMNNKIVAVVGGGVVGLAIARAVARHGRVGQVLLLERHTRIGQECSSRNSQVIHAGIYYPKNSLKAALCVQGREKLYSFSKDYHVPHQKCGKFIVATTKNQVHFYNLILFFNKSREYTSCIDACFEANTRESNCKWCLGSAAKE